MTVNSELILNYMKQNYGKEMTKKDIAVALGISVPAVIGTVNALTKRGFCVTTREEEVELAPATETRKAKVHTVKYHTLTEAGLAYDPVQEAEERAAAKEAEKARKRAEREAAKAAE